MSLPQPGAYGLHPLVLPATGRTACPWPLAASDLPPDARSLKRRFTNNRKERRRTLSINAGLAELRCKIPFVPADSKLSKIKTLKLATAYIAFLRELLNSEEGGSAGGVFKPDLSDSQSSSAQSADLEAPSNSRRSSGRTGWPLHVWALELKQENPSVAVQVGDEFHTTL